MEKIREFRNCRFNLDTKELTIENGSCGTYLYTNIRKCDVLNEEARFKGKTEPFLHQVLATTLQTGSMHISQVYVGLKLVLKNGEKLYIYVTDKPTQPNSLQFYDDRRKAEEIKEFVTRIIHKYKDKES